MERLYNGKEIIYDAGGDKTPTPSETIESTDELGDEAKDTDENLMKVVPSSYEDVERLCKEVWPALAVMGGVDGGLRVGAKCIHKPTGKRAIILGTLRVGHASVKVQWEDGDSSLGYN